MNFFPRIRLSLKALALLGIRPAAFYVLYQAKLFSGLMKHETPIRPTWLAEEPLFTSLPFIVNMPSGNLLGTVLGQEGRQQLLREAEEICRGRVRLFGGPPVALELKPAGKLCHWTEYERGRAQVQGVQDVKWIWETGRFGWVYPLGRAYCLTGDDRYAESFWQFTQSFLMANPLNLGPHWISAQEAAIRLLGLVFGLQAFAQSPHSTPERLSCLRYSIRQHARRITASLFYAQAQNNNHLLLEALGLLTAAAVLPGDAHTDRWRKAGWRLFHQGVRSQIAPDGAYIQHSTNYHRLMLQAALWARRLAFISGVQFPPSTCSRLAAAASWLLKMVDLDSGRVPNLGPNDGAYILPFTSCPFADFRPVVQAACVAFLGEKPFPPGMWDEMQMWLVGRDGDWDESCAGGPACKQEPSLESSMGRQNPSGDREPSSVLSEEKTPHILRGKKSWGYFRAVRFTSRPGHADQLHLDLWWKGVNMACDAGAYLYNADPPWNNSLRHNQVHNTVTVNGEEAMTSAGRFLYLDWPQARIIFAGNALDAKTRRICAEHDGYRRFNVRHRREVSVDAQDQWEIIDDLLPIKERKEMDTRITARLHWLLPDFAWKIAEDFGKAELVLESPKGKVNLEVELLPVVQTNKVEGDISVLPERNGNIGAFSLVKAGEIVYGQGPSNPTWGWIAPTYGYKIPALSFAVSVRAGIPLRIISKWRFESAD